MANKINCWVDLDEIKIPPIKKQGFQEDIVIRKKINPVIVKHPKPESVSNDIVPEDPFKAFAEEINNLEGEEPTVLLSQEVEEGEEATVLLNRKLVAELYLKQEKTGEIFRVDKERFVIGKSRTADFTVKDNPTVSRQHAAVYRENGLFMLKDLESGNHTFVEGEMLTKPVKLVDGMKFTLSVDEVFEVTINTRFE